MLLKSWRSVILLLTLVLAACGTADTTDRALSDTGVQASATPDSAYPVLSTATSAPTATAVSPTATSVPTDRPLVQATMADQAITADDPVEIIVSKAIHTAVPASELHAIHILQEKDIKLRVFDWSYDGRHLIIGRSPLTQTLYDISLLDVTTLQETFIESGVKSVVVSPSSDEYIFIKAPQKTQALNAADEIFLWSNPTKTSIKLPLTEDDLYKPSQLLWNAKYGIVYNHKETGQLNHINTSNLTRNDLKLIPQNFKKEHSDQIFDFVPAPNGDHGVLFERKWDEGSATIALVHHNNLQTSFTFDNVNHRRPVWSDAGSYVQIYPITPPHSGLDLYTNEGKHAYHIEHVDGGVVAQAWGYTDRYVVYEAYVHGGKIAYGIFILDLQTKHITQLPIFIQDVDQYSYWETHYAWSPDSAYIVVNSIYDQYDSVPQSEIIIYSTKGMEE